LFGKVGERRWERGEYCPHCAGTLHSIRAAPSIRHGDITNIDTRFEQHGHAFPDAGNI
ncbi:hypothetical protein K0M31_018448, partial [Melipona bicolor]